MLSRFVLNFLRKGMNNRPNPCLCQRRTTAVCPPSKRQGPGLTLKLNSRQTNRSPSRLAHFDNDGRVRNILESEPRTNFALLTRNEFLNELRPGNCKGRAETGKRSRGNCMRPRIANCITKF